MLRCEEGPAAASRRPETASDAAFRVRLFCETWGTLFAGLDPALADLLLRQQFAAQDSGYRAAYPEARFDIVEVGEAPVGRIVTAETAGAAVVVDLALLPDWRGRGIGTRLLRALCGEDHTVRLSVAAGNAGALRLYERLGFAVVGRREPFLDLERRPG